MKLRIDIVALLSFLWLSSIGFSQELSALSLFEEEQLIYETTDISNDGSGGGSSDSDNDELTPIQYEGWSLYEGWPYIYFIPTHIAKEATKISNVTFSEDGILSYEYEEFKDTIRLVLRPIKAGNTNVTIYASDNKGRSTSTTFPIEVKPYVPPIPKDIGEQSILIGEKINFHVRDIANDEVIPIHIKSVIVDDNSLVQTNFDIRNMTIRGLNEGSTTVTAQVYNVADWSNVIDISIPVTVTGDVYGN